MPITMRDVAKKAGVSIKTVSRVVNNQGEVSETTRQHVQAAIKELGYRPSLLARALVTQSTCTVGLVVPDISNPFFPEVARGVLDAAQANDYNIFLCNTDGDLEQERKALESLADHGVDGVILYPSYDSYQNIQMFTEYLCPLMLINYEFEYTGVGHIMLDNQNGANLAVNYLAGKGHKAIGMLAGVANPNRAEIRRIQGYRETMRANHLVIRDGWIVPSREPSIECGYESAKLLLTDHPNVTAIFTYNDLLAIGALRACRAMGRRVPDDCAIVGFDDIQLAAMVTPTLTSVRVDKYTIGYQAMIRLLTLLEHPEAELPPICLNAELTIRESA